LGTTKFIKKGLEATLKIYVCAPNKYEKYTKYLADRLEKNGYMAYYAARNTDQNKEDNEIFESNLDSINNCDVFISYFVYDGYYGIDFASETGYASKYKKVIGFIEIEKKFNAKLLDNLDDDLMLKHFIDAFFDNFEDLLTFLRSEISC